MSLKFLNSELRKEYEQIKMKIKAQNNKASLIWKRFVSNEMLELERKEYKEKINRLSNRALVDFEEGEFAKSMFKFYEKAIKYDNRNLELIGDFFTENHLFILATRRESIQIVEIGLKKLGNKDENYDPRDTILSLTILYNCLLRMNINPRDYFKKKSKTVERWLGETIEQYLQREENINTFQAMGYTETNKPKFGLIWTG